MKRRRDTGLFEAFQMSFQQEEAMRNPRKPVETPLTAEQRAARRQQQIQDGWIALNERYRREAEENKRRKYL